MPSTGTPAATVSASRSHVAGSQGARSSSQALIRPPRTSSPTPGDVGTGSPAKGRTRWRSTPSSQPAKRSSGATVSCWSTVTWATRPPYGWGAPRRRVGLTGAGREGRSQLPLGQLAELLGHPCAAAERGRQVPHGGPAEAVAHRVHRAVHRPPCGAGGRARAPRVGRRQRELELDDLLPGQVGDGDAEERDLPLPLVVERLPGEPLGDL